MLRLVAEKCTEILQKHGAVQEDKKAIYIYGFELFWSTSACIISILLFGAAGGYLGQAVVFLLCFVPIRTAAGGYHAKSYGRCFLLTNLIAVACVMTAGHLWAGRARWTEGILWAALLAAFAYIWNQAPVNSPKHPLKPERVVKNRRYAHVILIGETAVFLLIRLFLDRSVIYTGILTSCVVAVMIKFAEKGGE
ncbi:MAG: accessory gene regulator B family protein [Lachnospiraceae bacterium]|nr:accessory gene regulator B family protein [Lachnospiraceae bacterium]